MTEVAEYRKDYVAIFVKKDTRKRIKIKATKKGKTMMDYLEEVSKGRD